MFLDIDRLESEMLETFGHALLTTKGMQTAYLSYYNDKHMLYWGRVFSMKFDRIPGKL